MMKHLALGVLVACGTEPTSITTADLAQTTDGGVVVEPSLTNFCRTVTVKGTMYYNDLRTDGRFDLRDHDPSAATPALSNQAPGAMPYSDSRGTKSNYYGLRDAQVDIYEADNDYGAGASCAALTHYGTTTIDKDGTFTWTGQVCETCGADTDGGDNDGNGKLSIAVKVSLRNCTGPSARCFSVADPQGAGTSNHFDDDWGGVTYSKWFATASNLGPRVTTATVVDVGVDRFEISPTGQTAKAANVFAGLVDVTRKVHLLLNVPFGHDEVVAYYPGVSGTHSHESGRICVTDRDDYAWIDGKEPAHEYGHLLHFWQWGGVGKWVAYDYDANGNGKVDGDEAKELANTKEWNNAAFKEGWANFIAGVTFDQTGSPRGCDQKDDVWGPSSSSAMSTDGRHYIDDVQVALCEVWDDRYGCQLRNGINYCDDTNFTLNEMLDALGDAFDASASKAATQAATQANPLGTNTLGVCSLMGQLYDRDPSTLFALGVNGLDCDL